jgi:uncharacterized protein YciI
VFNPETLFEMKNAIMSHLRIIIPLICTFTIGQSLPAQAPKSEKPKQFIYVLRLVPRLYDDKSWTREDNAVLERHFARLQEAAKSGQVILAGRTKEPGDQTFGIAIFEASDEAAARAFMQADPAVSAGLMTAELHPFAVALEHTNP